MNEPQVGSILLIGYYSECSSEQQIINPGYYIVIDIVIILGIKRYILDRNVWQCFSPLAATNNCLTQINLPYYCKKVIN